MNDFVELQHLIGIVVRRWWLLVLLTITAAALGYMVSRAQTPVYQATTTILVGQSITSSTLERVDIQTSQALVQTYVDIARRKPVLDGVVKTLNLEGTWQDLKGRIAVNPVSDTQLIEIKAEAGSPAAAEAIADELAHQLLLISPSGSTSGEEDPNISFNRQQIQNLQAKILEAQQRLDAIAIAMQSATPATDLTLLKNEKQTLEGLIIEWERNYTELLPLTVGQHQSDPNQVTVIETAHASNVPIRPRVQLYTILSGVLGLVLAAGLIFLIDFVDDTYKTLDDVPRSDELDILGSVGKIGGKKHSGKLIAQLEPYSALTESYRIIRSRIRFKSIEKPARLIMVTSSMPKEGKSVTAANLAVVFAQANIRTVIVDADLRHPVLHHVFRAKNETGLGDLLDSPDTKVENCLQETSIKNLRILTSGKALVDPSERLGSERMTEIVTELKQAADIVIFDSPPVLVFADAIDLSRLVDGVVVMIRAGRSRREAISQALFDLRNARAHLLGSIFNHSAQASSLSVRRSYIQERRLFPFERVLRRKLMTTPNQIVDLSEMAAPDNENLALAHLGDNGRDPELTASEDTTTDSRNNHRKSTTAE